jgi:predicted 2-oxoglutarate/Fe(II)-dependent dioxygenase YbiX
MSAHRVDSLAMLKASFFTRMGLFVIESFLSGEDCRRICREIRSSNLVHATIGEGSGDEIDLDSRTAKLAQVSTKTSSTVRKKLLELMPTVGQHFKLKLTDVQGLQFLAYRIGDFYIAHADDGDPAQSPSYVQKRRISVVIFLNGMSIKHGREGYEGGALGFSGLIDHPRLGSSVYPLSGQAGRLVAFPSSLVHQVMPVTRGERYTIATWFI